MNNKTIAIFSNDPAWTYNLRKELIEVLLQKGYSVLIAVGYGRELSPLIEKGCECYDISVNRRGKNPFQDIALLIKYCNLLLKKKPDLLLTYTIKPNVYGGIACQICRKPYIANVTGLGTSIENGGLLGAISTTLYKIGLRKASCVFFQNSENQKLFKNKRIVKENTRLIPGSGVNIEMHCIEDYPSKGNCKFLFIGRIMRDKGINELLEAICALYKKYPTISLDIVGGCDENYEQILIQACDTGFVRYHGQQQDVHNYIKNAHCVVLPSYHEGTANVMLEAQSTGRPVITTKVAGCRETFDEGITGLGCEAKNVDSLVEAMEKFINLSYDEKRKMGINGRKKMECEYDRNIVIGAYLDEIEKTKLK